MRVRLFLALALVAVVALGAAPAVSAAPACPPKGAKIAKKKGKVRVYSVKSRRSGKRYLACARGGRRVFLGRVHDDGNTFNESVGRFTIAGQSVAAVRLREDEGAEDVEEESLRVADLRSGGRTYSTGFTRYEDGFSTFARVLLRADGAAAWSLEGFQGDHEVQVLGAADRRSTRVARAADISPRSLQFGGDGVTWVQAGVTRTAAIP